MAGVSSFGMGGTNAHVIVAAAPDTPAAKETAAAPERPHHLLALSAKSEPALRDLAGRYADFLESSPNVILDDVCATAHTGRNHFAHRLSVCAPSSAQMQAQLVTFASGKPDSGVTIGFAPGYQKRPKVAFLFTGQGSQYVQMGRELYDSEPRFRQIIDECDAAFQDYWGESLIQLLYPPATDRVDSDARIVQQMAYAQPAIFAVQCGLARLWRAWGIEPDVLIGHSLGEFAAAWVAGVFSLADGLRLVAERGRLLQSLPPDGEMAAVMASEGEVRERLADHPDVTIAAINAPQSVVLSGRKAALEAAVAMLQERGKKVKRLNIPIAAHSPQTEPILEAFEQVARAITLSPPRLRLVSSLTGALVDDEVTAPVYWRRHLRQPVRFAAGMETVLAREITACLEIGPTPTLLSMVQQPTANSQQPTALLPSLHPDRSDWRQMLQSLGALYGCGAAIDWDGFHAHQTARNVILPTYPFQRRRHWVETAARKAGGAALRPLIETMTRLPLHNETVFVSEFSVDAPAFLADHRVYNQVVAPGACHLSMLLSAAELAWAGPICYHLTDILFPAALVIPANGVRTVQVVWTPHAVNEHDPAAAVQLLSFDPADTEQSPVIHATGRTTLPNDTQPAPLSLDAVRARCPHEVALTDFYRRLDSQHITLGARFRWLAAVWRGEGEALSQVVLPDSVNSMAGYVLHPGLLDACFQTAAILGGADDEDATFLPFAVESLHVYPAAKAPAEEWWGHARQTGKQKWDIRLLDAAGQVMAEIVGFEVRKAAPDTVGAEPWRDWLYAVEWRAQPLPEPNSEPDLANQTWLLLADELGVSEALATQLSERGAQPILVHAGEGYQQDDAHTFHIRPDCADDYRRLFEALSMIDGVVCLWTVHELTIEPADADADLVDMARGGCGAILALVQALVQSRVARSSLCLVTRGARAVNAPDGADGVPQLAHATVWGLGNVIALEHPELNCVRVDLDPTTAPREQANALFAELLAGATVAPADDQIALRNGTRHVARLVRHAAQTMPPLPIDDSDTYLITGGLGGLGLVTAQWLAEQGARHLLLLGRSAPGPDAQRQIDALRTGGVTVTVAQVDVTERAQLARVLDAIDPVHPLRGVIHSVGVLDDGALLQQDWERFIPVLAPKIQGAWNLHALTRDTPLDFFVFYASAAGLLGNWGQANHAAANAFLDALAHHRRAQGLPAVSIDWGAWSQVGAAAALSAQERKRLTERGGGLITPEQGCAALAHVLTQDAAQIGVVPICWARYLRHLKTPSLLLAEFAAEQTAPDATAADASAQFRQQLIAAPPKKRRNMLTAHVQSQVAAVLGMSQSPAQQVGFAELGMDSMMTLELKKRLEQSVQITLPATVVFEYPTIAALATYLYEEVLPAAEPAPDDTIGDGRATPADEPSDEPADQAALDALSTDELAHLLAEKLEMLE